jgi:DNA-binding MarR family transcriptional regulator
MSTEFPDAPSEVTPATRGYEDGVTRDDVTAGDMGKMALQEGMGAFALESSFFLQAVADRLGMGATDFSCLTVLLVEGPAPAGRLAQRTGLTTGAITGLIDRLERAGWVRRVADPTDRRRVIVEAVTARAGELRPIMDPILRAAAEVQAGFDAAEQDAILRFVERSVDMLGRQVGQLRGVGLDGQQGAGPADDGVVRVARNGVAEGQLGVHGTGTEVRISVEDLGGTLCRVDFGDKPASVTAHGGRVDVSHGGRGRWRSRDNRGVIVLHRDVRWDLALRGGASRVDIDMRGGRLVAIGISGGASTVSLALPAPLGVVPIRLSGGASRVRVTRPAGVAVSAQVRGGAISVKVDGETVAAGGRGMGIRAVGRDGYEFDIRGGASSVEVVEESLSDE